MLRTGPVLLLVVEKTGKITPSPSRRELSRENDPSTTTTMASARHNGREQMATIGYESLSFWTSKVVDSTAAFSPFSVGYELVIYIFPHDAAAGNTSGGYSSPACALRLSNSSE